MPNIVQITLKNNNGKWSYGVIKDDTYTEKTTDEIESIQGEIDSLVAFANIVKTTEEKQVEELETKNQEIIDKMISVTPEDKLIEIKDIFDEYEVGIDYATGKIFREGDFLYKVLQPHTSQADWIPGTPGTASLYAQVGAKDEIFEFGKNPDGSDRDLGSNWYTYNDKVIFEGWVWNSLIDKNVWSPTAHPAGWEKEREVL